MKIIHAAISLFILVPSLGMASEDYKCKVIEAKQLEKSGALGLTSWSKMQIGQEFVVEGTTGKIIGDTYFSNHNGAFGQPKVIDTGSNEQSFKALTVYEPHVAVSYLQIMEFENGNKKPFLLLTSGDNVLTGICVHF